MRPKICGALVDHFFSCYIMDNLYKIIATVVAIYLGLIAALVLFTRFERTITVRSKEGYGSRRRGQLVTDTDDNVYAVSNQVMLLHFRSAEVFGKMEAGKTYKVSGYGVRIPFLGMFPNITSVKS